MDARGEEILFRPMRPADVPAAEEVKTAAFRVVDEAATPRGLPLPEPRTPGPASSWRARTEHLLGTDPAGCWVAALGDEVVGFATSLVRDSTWILATYAVRPGWQGHGVGTALLAAAEQHGRHCLRAMLSSSSDPAAVRRYRLSGFALHPQMYLRGRVDRAAIPAETGARLREGAGADLDLCDSVDRRVRDAAHGPDHRLLAAGGRLLVAPGTGGTRGQGYAWLDQQGQPVLLAATDRRTAASLLWAALADAPEDALVPHVTAANQWALDVGLAARLEVRTEGYLALRGMRPPTPYVHHGALL